MDAQVLSSFTHLDHKDILSGSLDKGFAEALSLMEEVSKINTSIRSCNVIDYDYLLFVKPICITLNDLETSLSDVLNSKQIDMVIAYVLAAHASRSKGFTKK